MPDAATYPSTPCSLAASSVFSRRQATVIGPVPPGIGVTQPGDAGDGVEVDIADDAGLGAADAHVDDGRPGLHDVGGDDAGDAHGRHHDVGLADDARQVGRAGVGDRDGGVGALAGQEQRHGKPDEVGAAEHDGSAPRKGTSWCSSSCITPRGVQGTRPASPRTRRPRLRAVSPSTSFSGGMRSMTGSAARPSGRGSWTRMPCTAGSAARPATTSSTSAWLAVGGQVDVAGQHPDLGRLLLLGGHVALARRVVAHQHRRQADRWVPEGLHLLGDALAHQPRQHLAVHDHRSHHRRPYRLDVGRGRLDVAVVSVLLGGEVVEHGHGGVAAVEGDDPAGRVGGGAAEVEPGDRVRGVRRCSHIWSGIVSPWKMWPPVRPMRSSMSGGPSTSHELDAVVDVGRELADEVEELALDRVAAVVPRARRRRRRTARTG